MTSGDSTKTCSCIRVTPRSAVSRAPRTVLICDISPPGMISPIRYLIRGNGQLTSRIGQRDESNLRRRRQQVRREKIVAKSQARQGHSKFSEEAAGDVECDGETSTGLARAATIGADGRGSRLIFNTASPGFAFTHRLRAR